MDKDIKYLELIEKYNTLSTQVVGSMSTINANINNIKNSVQKLDKQISDLSDEVHNGFATKERVRIVEVDVKSLESEIKEISDVAKRADTKAEVGIKLENRVWGLIAGTLLAIIGAIISIYISIT